MASPAESNIVTGNGKIAILAAGSFGCTLGYVFATGGKNVCLWHVNHSQAELLNKNRRLEKPIAVDIAPGVEVTSDLQVVTKEASILLFTCTSQSMQEVAGNVYHAVKDRKDKPILVSAVKGIETKSFKRMSEILKETFPGFAVACLSGPNLAVEMAKGLPTAAAIAADSEEIAEQVQNYLNTKSYRLYTNDDLIGVELGGALKNIYAIAAGCVDGLNLGTNAKSTLLTRALVEMSRFNADHGGKPATMVGLAGIGDLIATCTSPLSRNYRLGFELAQGTVIDEAIKKLGAVAEGVPTCHAVNKLAHKLALSMPIAEQVEAVLTAATTPKQAIKDLFERPLSKE
jgi:glycerol-3-phosphate dehydrogenase (NAD(P)+)